jgi:hypothetical protein
VNSLQGNISNIRRRPLEGGVMTTFSLRSADGKEWQVETRLDFPLREGDLVQVSGEVNSDLVLTANSITPVASQPVSPTLKPKLYILRTIVAVLLAMIPGAFLGGAVAANTISPTATITGGGRMGRLENRRIIAKTAATLHTRVSIFGGLISAVFASGLAWLFAGSNRRANAWLGARISVGLSLAVYVFSALT